MSPGGSSAGVPHTEVTKALLRALRLGTKLSADTKALIGAGVTGELNGFYGKTHIEENVLRMTLANSLGYVYLYNSMHTLLMILPSVKTLGNLIECNHATLKAFISSGNLFRGGWYLTNTPLVVGVLLLFLIIVLLKDK